ncbi:hypothetical protein JD844_022211 [Phrynosoma platyrhinos]|uniref:Rab-GAP TBC domain-containing protein n=1 Tax=Phrynosoma platyrhinos TaxID=52577 RepID=A0ABQ7SV30_PHRPL|nr:hypothetical protein JD844_022211 [Phrynosoma platyrhinos]
MCSLGQISVEIIRHRETKWLDMTAHWEKTMARRYRKVKLQCRKGIPSSIRARCWPLLCGGQAKMERNPGKYQELYEGPCDPQWVETITKDIHRQFPFHEIIERHPGSQERENRVHWGSGLLLPSPSQCPIPDLLKGLLPHPPEESHGPLEHLCLLLQPLLHCNVDQFDPHPALSVGKGEGDEAAGPWTQLPVSFAPGWLSLSPVEEALLGDDEGLLAALQAPVPSPATSGRPAAPLYCDRSVPASLSAAPTRTGSPPGTNKINSFSASAEYQICCSSVYQIGQQGLLQVLKAYTVYRPQEGYCQAQGPLGALLLMHMPPEQAFWCLVQICEHYLPGYYSPQMEALLLDSEVFVALLRRVCPKALKHLQKHGVGPLLYLPEWFLCLFTRTLPFPTVLRVWDAFLSEGES